MAYPYLLIFHNWIRWIALIAGLLAFAAAARGWSARRPGDSPLSRWSIVFVAAMDLQFLIGLILYLGVSPLTRAAFSNMAAAMKDHEQRFFVAEHTTYMIIAVLLAHVGGMFLRKARNDPGKYRAATLAFAASLLLMAVGIPWWRPLLRMMS
jgi:hypothetical protein